MAKPLHEPLPSSSIARLLDRTAAARATAPPSSVPLAFHPAAPSTRPDDVPQPLARVDETPACTKREFTLCSHTDDVFSQLADIYRRTTRTRLSNSHVMRALLRGVAHCLDGLELEAHKQLVPQKLPSNARGRQEERARFEERLARVLIAGIRATSSDEGHDPILAASGESPQIPRQ